LKEKKKNQMKIAVAETVKPI